MERSQVVGFPTWLWLEGWRPRVAAALGVTVTATPISADWSLVDAATSCAGPGEAYDPTHDRGDAGRASDCSVVFTHDSHGQPDGTYHGAVTVHWALTWRGPGGATGALPGRTSTIPVRLHVIELVAATD